VNRSKFDGLALVILAGANLQVALQGFDGPSQCFAHDPVLLIADVIELAHNERIGLARELRTPTRAVDPPRGAHF
jgi:hypothetical protein